MVANYASQEQDYELLFRNDRKETVLIIVDFISILFALLKITHLESVIRIPQDPLAAPSVPGFGG